MSLLDTASLIVTPNGYKEGKLYSVIPSDGSGDLSVTRATTATRVNSAGLVELVPYNLWLYSQEFNNAEWLKTECTITANAIAAPDGTLTAEKITDTTANNEHRFRATSGLFTIAGATTFSIYAKAAEYTKFAIANLSDGYNVIFNLSTGVVDSVGTDWSNAQITSVGNGWYRLSATISVNKTIGYGLVNGSGNFVFTGTGTSGVYIWGAQAVEGTTAKDYQKTETRLNIPRLDYSNGTCPSILVEPQRTNLLTYSSSFDNGAWVKYGTSINANSIISPSGIQDADKIIENSFTGIHLLIQGTQWDTNSRTASLYVKAAERTKFYIANTSAEYGSFFNLGTGTIDGNIGPFTSTIEDVGNGWYRITATHTAAASQTFAIGIYTTYTGNFTTTTEYAGTSGNGLYIWGAQVEAGSYATSYIPTTSASVTRNADVISKTGISSLIGQTEGTVFADFVARGSATQEILGITVAGGGVEYIALISTSNGYLYFASNISGLILISTNSYNQRFKVAYSFESGNHILYANGNVISSFSSASVYSTLNAIYLGSSAVATGIELLKTNAVSLWKTRLTNTQLAQLTTI